MTDSQPIGLPWEQTPQTPQTPVRRKVSWGSGATADEATRPQRRAGSPAAPVFGAAFPEVPLAGPEAAAETAHLHAGAAHVTPTPMTDWSPAAPTAPEDLTADLASVFDDEDPAPAPTPSPGGPGHPEPAAGPAEVVDAEVVELEASWVPPHAEPAAHGEAPGWTPDPLPLGAPLAEPVADAPVEDLATPAPGAALVPAHETVTPDPAPQPVAVAPWQPRAAEPAAADQQDLFGPAAAPEGDLASMFDEPEPEPEPEPVPAPAAGRGAPRFDLAARRAALEAARQHSAAELAPDPADATTRRYTHEEYYYSVVDRILGLGRGGDPELQAMIQRLELTRDKQLDATQRLDYQSMLEPRLATANIQIASAADRDVIFDIAYDEMLGIGPLGPLWRDDSVTEIMVSGPFKVTVERNGRLERTPVRFRSQTHLEQTSRTLTGLSADDRAVSSTNPLVTIQLPRARVQFIWRPLAVSKVAITIRKFGDLMDMGQLLTFGSLTEEMAAFLCDAVVSRATVLVSGGTGSGKTTFINAVSEFIPDTERVITIEDALELQLRNTHVESLVTKEAASADDTTLFGQDQLLKASLRMRPDRIIVGEIRDGKGASVMLEAANTGHDGTMTTIHANSPELALNRMGTLLRRVENMPDDVAKAEVATAINVVVQVVRKRGRRFVSRIAVVDPHTVTATGSAAVTPVFVGDLPAEADRPEFRRVAGIRPDTDLAIKMTDAGLDPAVWE